MFMACLWLLHTRVSAKTSEAPSASRLPAAQQGAPGTPCEAASWPPVPLGSLFPGLTRAQEACAKPLVGPPLPPQPCSLAQSLEAIGLRVISVISTWTVLPPSPHLRRCCWLFSVKTAMSGLSLELALRTGQELCGQEGG